MGIEDDYVAFCFNEACMYIENMLKDEKAPKPKWKKEKSKKPQNNSELINKLSIM